jgi:shikimate kinase
MDRRDTRMATPALGAHIVITGAMGVGKTTVGRLLAVELGVAFFDSDEVLEEKTGEAGFVIAAREGVEQLHGLELEVFLDTCRHPTTAVIASAASVVDHEAGREALANNFTVWLTAPGDVLSERRTLGEHRRVIEVSEQLELDQTRAPLLEQVSRVTLDTASATPAEVVTELLGRLVSPRKVKGDV